MSNASSMVSRSQLYRSSRNASWGAITPALLAAVVLALFRAGQHRWPAEMWVETLIFVAIPFVFYQLIFPDRVHPHPFLSSFAPAHLARGAAVLVSLLVIVWQSLSRSWGLGDANEVVVLLVLQNIAWCLAVFSRFPGIERASLFLSGALVLVICCLTEQHSVLAAGGLFAVVALWSLMGLYWSRLDDVSVDGHSRKLALNVSSVAISAVLIGLAGGASLLFTGSGSQLAIDGFMPFSGGEHGFSDEFAQSGIGDGRMLTAGKNATTTGAVDSDEFIEDNKPSIYDVMTERYDGPVVKKPRNRAVPLDVLAKHLHNVKQSELAGQTFRTMRDSERLSELELEDRRTGALFFVEGSVPARFAVDTFHHFDGWDWSKISIEGERPLPAQIELQQRGGKPTYTLARYKPDYLVGRRAHTVKIMRLQSPSLPAPALLSRWHIAHVSNPNLFRWNDAGLVVMDGESIPPHTVIDIESFVPNYHILRRHGSLRQREENLSGDRAWAGWWNVLAGKSMTAANSAPLPSVADSPFLQLPDDSKGLLEQRVKDWTRAVKPGWAQVEAIVKHIRNEFTLRPDWEVDASIDNTVTCFLETRAGPSYMFATTCAMALRSAGYKTRLTSGFVVQKRDYDRRARQSIVTAGNLHFWPEVCLDDKYWIPVEPTPGYPIPYSTETLGQWMLAKVLATVEWVRTHPISTILLGMVLLWAVIYRAEWTTGLMLGWWYLVRFLWPAGLLRATRQVIDARFHAAGDRRPASSTIQSWYSRVDPGLPPGFFSIWNATNYSTTPHPWSRREVVAHCRAQLDSLTLRKIREHHAHREQAKK